MSNLNKYPIYVPSKDRSENCLTVKYLIRDKIDFYLVVEPSQVINYEKYYKKYLLVMPKDNMKLLGTRNWIRNHSIKNGFKRHWQLDDNIRGCKRLYKGVRIRCNMMDAIRFMEDITDNYSNVGVSGLNYEMFVSPNNKNKPIVINHHVYSFSLINNEMPYVWRLIYNDDTDLCIQILDGGLCTLYTNIFMACKAQTMTIKGGNTDQLYKGRGRLVMARTLEKVWPDIVKTKWRFGRPQHVVKWEVFKHGLIRSDDYKEINIDDYGKLKILHEIKSNKLRKILGVDDE